MNISMASRAYCISVFYSFVLWAMLILSASCLLCLSGRGAAAQDTFSGTVRLSSSEDVMIAFYKTAGILPDFDPWIRGRDPYRSTMLLRRDKVYAQERNRLRVAWNAYDPQKDILTVRAYVRGKMEPSEDGKNFILQLQFEGAEGVHYFPYDFLDESIALVPLDLDEHMRITLSPQEHSRISSVPGQENQATMILRLRPVRADKDMLYVMDGRDRWVLLADIAALSIWSRKGVSLWNYSAGF